MRVFLDTNVLVSAFTTRGLCADIVREVLAGHIMVTSEQVLTEAEAVLIHRMRVPKNIVNEIVALLRGQEVAPVPQVLPDIAVRDADDLAIIAAAIAGHADVLVSGDKDVTSLVPFRPLRIATPREFWTLISS